MTPEECTAIVFDIVRDGFTATEGDLTVAASDTALDGAMVRMTLTATRDGSDVPLDNPYWFVNPPIAVADGADVIVDPEYAVREMLLTAVA